MFRSEDKPPINSFNAFLFMRNNVAAKTNRTKEIDGLHDVFTCFAENSEVRSYLKQKQNN